MDWSGAKTAGKTIFLADAELAAATSPDQTHLLTVSRVCCAAALPGSSAQQEPAITAVREHLTRSAPIWVGLDAPVGLNLGLMRAACGRSPYFASSSSSSSVWRAFVEGYSWDDADQMREWARGQAGTAGGGSSEPKRVCDVAAKAPFAPTNLRLYRQTHAAVAQLLRPMLLAEQLSVVPNSLPRGAGAAEGEASSSSSEEAALRPVRLLECCPASLLKRVGLYDQQYKARTTHARAARARILGALCDEEGVAPGHGGGARVRVAIADEAEEEHGVASALREAILSDAGGDALDAVLAALIVALALTSGALPQPPEGWAEEYWEEGCIYY